MQQVYQYTFIREERLNEQWGIYNKSGRKKKYDRIINGKRK